MQDTYPGYQPSQANLEYVQAQILASLAADLANQCSNGGTELFRTFGTQLVGVAYQQGVAAQASIVVTAQASPAVLATLSAALVDAGGGGGPIVSLPVQPLAYGISAGTILLTDPSVLNTQTWTTPGANAGDTQISVTSQTPNFAYPIASTVGPLGSNQQYLIPTLSQFTLDTFGFTNLAPATLNGGDQLTVLLTAVQTGEIFNGAGAGGNVQSIQELPWITGFSIQSIASGGAEPEDDAHYLDRLASGLQLQAPRPVTAADYATMALNFSPYPGTDQQDVGRATSIDGYNPADGSSNNQRMVTVCATDANGFALNADTLYGYPGGSSSNIITTIPTANAGWGIAGWLRSLREIGFVVNIIQPSYPPVYVTVTVKALPNWDQTSVAQNVQSALLSFLTPSAWGLPPPSITGWQNTTTINRSTITAIVQQATGVAYVSGDSLKFGLAPVPSNTADLVLPGAVALPTSSITTIPLGSITVT